jgi:hypothetical protein
MSIEGTFRELHIAVQRMHESLHGLRLILVDDQPPSDGTVLVDQFGYAADDLSGWGEEALQAIAAARTVAAEDIIDFDKLRRGLTLCHERQNRIARRFISDVDTYERIDQLLRFGKERRGEWTPWSEGVAQTVARCRVPVLDTSEALLAAWQELAERLGAGGVTVKATNIGQNISVPRESFASGTVP